MAKEARIRPGTLYRHFPTRGGLLEAVYRSETEKLAAAEQKFAEELPPIEALRAWLLLYVDYIAAKQLIAPALNALLGDPKKVFEASYTDLGNSSRTGETLDQKRRHPDGSRSDRPAAGSDRRCQ
jgi:AcrR family transcriptional regulator